LEGLREAARESLAPLDRLERLLHPWVAFGIMPLFALANAGVAVDFGALAQPTSLAVAFGLIVGKPVGILIFSAVAVRLGVARLPAGTDWRMLTGAACLAGVGFTMSLFIAGLAFGDAPPLLSAAKLGVLLGSAVSAALGLGLLLAFLPLRTGATKKEPGK
jgi:NhaA family Na+:H+ antiporter